jgi:hypothetical protein
VIKTLKAQVSIRHLVMLTVRLPTQVMRTLMVAMVVRTLPTVPVMARVQVLQRLMVMVVQVELVLLHRIQTPVLLDLALPRPQVVWVVHQMYSQRPTRMVLLIASLRRLPDTAVHLHRTMTRIRPQRAMPLVPHTAVMAVQVLLVLQQVELAARQWLTSCLVTQWAATRQAEAQPVPIRVTAVPEAMAVIGVRITVAMAS